MRNILKRKCDNCSDDKKNKIIISISFYDHKVCLGRRIPALLFESSKGHTCKAMSRLLAISCSKGRGLWIILTLVTLISLYKRDLEIMSQQQKNAWKLHKLMSKSPMDGKLVDIRALLNNEPPVPGMDFIAQRPALDFSYLPPGISKGHPYLKKRTYPKQSRNDSCHNCFPYIYKNVIGMKGCEDTLSLNIVLLVTTVPTEISLRMAIRKTWGRTTNMTRTVFLFGVGWHCEEQNILFHESEQFGDILQDNYIDSYFNLSLKVLSGYHWWSKYCNNTPFVVRTASDNFVNVRGLVKLIISKTLQPYSMVGKCPKFGVPNRTVQSKYYVSYQEYPHQRFPQFCIGTTYIAPATTIHFILRTFPNVPYFILADVYFGMVMNVKKKKGLTHIQTFNQHYRKIKTKCHAPSDLINIHGVRIATDMYWIWENCKFK